jgi:ketosteroid isomerase-like protein
MGDAADVVRQSYEAFARGDIPAVIDALSDDVTWDVAEVLPQGGSFRGRDGVQQFFEGFGQVWEEVDIDLADFIDGGDQVVGVGVGRGKLRGGGDAEYGFTHVFTVADGKVTRFREYADRNLAGG